MNESARKFGEQTRSLFDESVDRLDAETLSQLNQGRQRALAELRPGAAGSWLRWVPAAGMATAALVAVMVLVPGPADNGAVPTAVADMEILLGEDSIEMLEDLEFYSWIDMAEQGDDVG